MQAVEGFGLAPDRVEIIGQPDQDLGELKFPVRVCAYPVPELADGRDAPGQLVSHRRAGLYPP